MEYLGYYNAHKLKNYYYIFPNLAPYDFFFYYNKKKFIKFKIANDLELQKAIAEINKEKNTQH